MIYGESARWGLEKLNFFGKYMLTKTVECEITRGVAGRTDLLAMGRRNWNHWWKLTEVSAGFRFPLSHPCSARP